MLTMLSLNNKSTNIAGLKPTPIHHVCQLQSLLNWCTLLVRVLTDGHSTVERILQVGPWILACQGSATACLIVVLDVTIIIHRCSNHTLHFGRNQW